mmetsp:Transcript_36585/g.70232  ORF Transcript_36585/g.70232 Transcript_36585/m.70232 type:complete len:241 (-) Transcript_36585:669-1391(-)
MRRRASCCACFSGVSTRFSFERDISPGLICASSRVASVAMLSSMLSGAWSTTPQVYCPEVRGTATYSPAANVLARSKRSLGTSSCPAVAPQELPARFPGTASPIRATKPESTFSFFTAATAPGANEASARRGRSLSLPAKTPASTAARSICCRSALTTDIVTHTASHARVMSSAHLDKSRLAAAASRHTNTTARQQARHARRTATTRTHIPMNRASTNATSHGVLDDHPMAAAVAACKVE